jgi:hypothetical protein
MHREIYGITGYENSNHWCARGRQRLSQKRSTEELSENNELSEEMNILDQSEESEIMEKFEQTKNSRKPDRRAVEKPLGEWSCDDVSKDWLKIEKEERFKNIKNSGKARLIAIDECEVTGRKIHATEDWIKLMKMEDMRAVFSPICPQTDCCNPAELVCADMICEDNSQADAVCNPDTCTWSFNCESKSNFTKVAFDSKSEDFIFAFSDSDPSDEIPNPQGEIPTEGKSEKRLGVIGKFLIGISVTSLFLLFVAIAMRQ